MRALPTSHTPFRELCRASVLPKQAAACPGRGGSWQERQETRLCGFYFALGTIE